MAQKACFFTSWLHMQQIHLFPFYQKTPLLF